MHQLLAYLMNQGRRQVNVVLYYWLILNTMSSLSNLKMWSLHNITIHVWWSSPVPSFYSLNQSLTSQTRLVWLILEKLTGAKETLTDPSERMKIDHRYIYHRLTTGSDINQDADIHQKAAGCGLRCWFFWGKK